LKIILNREFASSRFVQLEVLPKAIFNKQQDETEFYETFFNAVIHFGIALDSKPLIDSHFVQAIAF
jgi:hypothetical protein